VNFIVFMVFEMENRNQNMSKTMGKASEAMERTAETMGDTIIAVLDKLAGTKSDLKLSFEDLTLDAGIFKARMNGAVVLDVVMAKEAEINA
jgi:hypothetical protein